MRPTRSSIGAEAVAGATDHATTTENITDTGRYSSIPQPTFTSFVPTELWSSVSGESVTEFKLRCV